MDSKSKKRVAGLDIVRAIAILFVISVHFFRNSGYYSHITISGEVAFITLLLRWLSYTCVPLFLLLTGYLNRNKKISKKYYFGIFKVLESYFFISLICIFARIVFFKEKHRKLYWLLCLFNFSANGYSWYIEMYISLFMLIPFLNVLYSGLKEKKYKQYLILTMLFVTSIGPIINGQNIAGVKLNVIPDFFISMYPLTYYFIGAYIGEYQVKIPKRRNMVELGILLLTEVSLYFINFYGEKYNSILFEGYQSLFTVLISSWLFLLLYDLDIKHKGYKKIISSISLVSLDMYLFSYLIDLKVYPIISEYIKRPIDYLKFFAPTVIYIFFISYSLSLIKKFLFDFLIKDKNRVKN